MDYVLQCPIKSVHSQPTSILCFFGLFFLNAVGQFCFRILCRKKYAEEEVILSWLSHSSDRRPDTTSVRLTGR